MAGLTAVADTNVIAYYLLESKEFYSEVKEFWNSIERAHAPMHWQAEWANVVWLAVRHLKVPERDGAAMIARARSLPLSTRAVAPLAAGALRRSLATGVAVYDTLFVELAAQQGCKLATYDGAVLKAFPDIARRPPELLG